jgi:uridine kinase
LRKRFIIGISGGSGAGKTTLSKAFIEYYSKDRIAYICLDSFYHDQSHIPHQERELINYDHPDSIDFKKLASVLGKLIMGQAANIPYYNFATHERSKLSQRINPTSIILLDGILLFHCPEILNMLDVKIFINISTEIRLKRRIQRDTRDRGRTTKSVIHQFYDTVLPMHELYVQPTLDYADLIVNDQFVSDQVIEEINSRIQNEFRTSK